ncbi:MAG: arginine--tRNA ligase [Gammaproteobacteria bacterium]
MKALIEKLVTQALDTLGIESEARGPVAIERARNPEHGDYATNAALVLAGATGEEPRALAAKIIAALPASKLVAKTEIAGPGFINFCLAPTAWHAELARILAAAERYGTSDTGGGGRILLEFVSANPTGPLHVGHGRNAAYGDSLARILAAAGYRIEREYYANDAGRQADILAVSVWLAVLALAGETPHSPGAGYPGDYIRATAEQIAPQFEGHLVRPWPEIAAGLPPDAPVGDKEAHMDALIARARTLLGEDYARLRRAALDVQIAVIRATLDRFDVRFDRWFSEETLVAGEAVAHALERLAASSHTYEADGALWLASSKLGDEKDRVLRRRDGSTTYFASDVAYHLDKLERGNDLLIDVWGADHHGYIARVRAAIEALSGRRDAFEVRLIQFVTLSSGRMGKRSGNFVTLDELLAEAGADAARFFYLARSHDQHLEFDVELARARTSDNPVYYVQYAHARVASVWRQLAEKGYAWNEADAADNLARLVEPQEIALLNRLARFPEVVATAAAQRAPHAVAHYLGEVAQAFHVWYNSCTFLVEDAALRNARLALAQATRHIIANGLGLLGVSAPERM